MASKAKVKAKTKDPKEKDPKVKEEAPGVGAGFKSSLTSSMPARMTAVS